MFVTCHFSTVVTVGSHCACVRRACVHVLAGVLVCLSERERETETERQREKDTERERKRDRQRDRERQTERELVSPLSPDNQKGLYQGWKA